jgi:hypothetical protein
MGRPLEIAAIDALLYCSLSCASAHPAVTPGEKFQETPVPRSVPGAAWRRGGETVR